MEYTIEVPVWVKRGGMMLRRDSLEGNDPDHTYNYLKSQGIVPEKYGVNHPDVAEAREYQGWSKSQLIKEILDIKKTLLAWEKAGF